MEQDNCTTRIKKYTHLSERQRYKMEALLESKIAIKEIAMVLGRDRSTIHREVRRGTINRIQTDLTEKKKYRANVGQANYLKQCPNRERSLKIGKDRKLEEYIRTKITQDRFSPDAIIGEIKAKGLKFQGMICTKTLYNYIDAGIFSGTEFILRSTPSGPLCIRAGDEGLQVRRCMHNVFPPWATGHGGTRRNGCVENSTHQSRVKQCRQRRLQPGTARP